MTGRKRRPVFGLLEAVILMLTLAAAVYGLGTTWLERRQTPAWFQPVQGVWT